MKRWLTPGKVCLILAFLLCVLILLSLGMGRYPVPASETVSVLLHGMGLPVQGDWTRQMEAAILNIRLPRVLLSCLVGACLSAAGCAYQGVFQNPMAAPDLLGASSGAAFGAALGILLRLGTAGIQLFAFLGSLICVGAAVLTVHRVPGKRVVNLILAGMMMSSLFSAGTSCIKLMADPGDQLPQITYWLMGSLAGSRMSDVLTGLIPMAAGVIPLLLLRWRINLLTLGEEEARTLGVRTGLLRVVVILCATLITAASVSLSGMIGWVGLVVPHLCRKAVGSDYRGLLPCSLLMGALFLLLVDDVCRNVAASEIPIGILTAFIGAPFFLILISRKEKEA